MGLGMSLMIVAGIGLEPITVFIEGLAKLLSISFSDALYYFNIFLFLFLIVANKNTIRLATFVTVLTLGYYTHVCLSIMGLFNWEFTYFLKILLVVMAAVCLGISIGGYISMDLGFSPIDGMIFWISDVCNIDFKYCMWMIHFLCLVLGEILGGQIGEGTIISVLLISPISTLTRKKLQLIKIQL